MNQRDDFREHWMWLSSLIIWPFDSDDVYLMKMALVQN